jgi:quercetin dioxygenase-like cupin family protein
VTDGSNHITTRESGEAITGTDRREVVLLTSQAGITVTYYRLADGQKGPTPHVHHEHTDAFYVLEGELGFELGRDREKVTLGAGGLVAAPPNFLHTFANWSGAENRFLNIHAPDGGFGAYMRGRRDGDREITFDTADPPADGGLPMEDGVVSPPGDGERLVSGNRTALLKGLLPDACFLEFEVNGPLGGPDPHAHADQVDSFYVLEGELEFTLEGERHVAGPGSFAAVPPGVEHTFAHRGEGTARFLNIHAPDGGFADLMRRVSD